MKGKYTRESSIRLLVEKQEALKLTGLSRYPQRSDFEAEEICAIKAFLGPWPRALEAAGLKPPRDHQREQLTAEKRIRAKRRHIEAIKRLQKEKKKAESAKTTDPHEQET